jgi:hypothetical protein
MEQKRGLIVAQFFASLRGKLGKTPTEEHIKARELARGSPIK